ncbi:7858_t:CDS:1, partial [Gigaspora rosea]
AKHRTNLGYIVDQKHAENESSNKQFITKDCYQSNIGKEREFKMYLEVSNGENFDCSDLEFCL